MKNFIKVGVLNLFILNGFLHAQTQNEINYSALEHGYNLSASQTLSPKDMSVNVRECMRFKEDGKLFYCIVGLAEKSSHNELISLDEMDSLNLQAYGQFVNERVEFVNREDFEKEQKIAKEKRIAKEKKEALKQKKADEKRVAKEKKEALALKIISDKKIEKDKIEAVEKKQISASNNFSVGIHLENFSEFGFNLGYTSSPESIRYGFYYTKHSFTNYGNDLGASEIGLNLLVPLFEYKLYGISPYVKIGAGQIRVSEPYYENGMSFYADVGGIYNINEYSEVVVGLRILDKVSVGRTFGSDIEYSSVGLNLSVNYWF